MLSCDNIQECEISLMQILDISNVKLNLIKEEIKKNYYQLIDWDVESFLKNHEIVLRRCLSVCFFHFTKTLNSDLYSKGLLILPNVIDDIIDQISKLYGKHSKNEIIEIVQSEIANASRIRLRRLDIGPYGYLIKEFGHIKDSGSWEYINGGEFVTDLLKVLKYDDSLYHSRAKSIVVKFIVHDMEREAYLPNIKEALLYVSISDETTIQDFNSAHDNMGKEIQPSDIISIDRNP